MVPSQHESKSMLTVGEVRDAAQRFLEERGVENARFVSEVLVSEVLGWDRLRVYLDFERPMSMPERDALRAWVRECAGGRPWQYVLGATDFYGHRIEVDPVALIPRPETELLVDRCLEAMKEIRPAHRLRVADVGTGTGCILVALASEAGHAEETQWIGIDRSSAALGLAARNIAGHGLAGVQLVQADLLGPVGQAALDVVVANLPYIPAGELEHLPRSVRDHEPHLALDGGAEGLDLVFALMEQSERALRPNGWLGMELGIHQAAAVRERLGQGPWEKIETIRDYAGIERIVTAYRAC
ncbi:MAG: peptide chain release factor N(5)-glutamine methyltransferase [Verrucomicrobiota bacterium]|nr:peptide chain release factor N(5)-glutamine methyltransferase [Verrucomicrobiota bacterium]